MEKLLNRVHEYLFSKEYKKEDILLFDANSIGTAKEIAIYAHQDQKRINNEPYINHPLKCLKLYREIFGLDTNNNSNIYSSLLTKLSIPYEGIQELCLLHDVLEDSEVTIEEIQQAFKSNGYNDFFNNNIKTPLLLLTHNKTVDYSDYIKNLSIDPSASLVKMIDICSNLNLMGLNCFNHKEYKRATNYILYFQYINDMQHFLEKITLYKEAITKENLNCPNSNSTNSKN